MNNILLTILAISVVSILLSIPIAYFNNDLRCYTDYNTAYEYHKCMKDNYPFIDNSLMEHFSK